MQAVWKIAYHSEQRIECSTAEEGEKVNFSNSPLEMPSSRSMSGSDVPIEKSYEPQK